MKIEIITENTKDSGKSLQEESQYYGWIKQIAEYISNMLYCSEVLRHIFQYNSYSALAKEAMKQGDYEGLSYIVRHSGKFQFLLDQAAEQLDIKAVKVVLDICPELKLWGFQAIGLAEETIKQENYERLSYIVLHTMENAILFLLDGVIISMHLETRNLNALIAPEISYEEAKARKKKVIITILNATDTFTEESLKRLQHETSTGEFDTFCKDHNIDLTLPEYKQMSALRQLYGRGTMQELKSGTNSIVDVVLSRTTIGKDVDAQHIRDAYLKILGSTPVAKEMLELLALRIIKGEKITIVIEQDLQVIADSGLNETAYYTLQQMIAIDLSTRTAHLTLESGLIHEIGHWFYNNLFHWGSLPLSRECLREAASALTKEERSDANIAKSATFFLTRNLSQEVECLAKYEEAAKQPLYKAAELVGVDLEHCAQTVQCADLLLMKFVKKYSDQYSSRYTYFKDGSLFVEVNIYGMLGLMTSSINHIYTATQKHFLERVFDYASRGAKVIKYQDHKFIAKELHPNALYRELIVRGPELAVSTGIEEDLLSSFDKLAAYHNEVASPLVRAEIDAHQAECIGNPLLTCIVGL